MGQGGTYKIRIHYREPSYERRHGSKKRPYHWTYSITATNPEEAKRRAVAEFEEIERLSSVGWGRKIVMIELDGDKDKAG